jgi:hypothetical protein
MIPRLHECLPSKPPVFRPTIVHAPSNILVSYTTNTHILLSLYMYHTKQQHIRAFDFEYSETTRRTTSHSLLLYNSRQRNGHQILYLLKCHLQTFTLYVHNLMTKHLSTKLFATCILSTATIYLDYLSMKPTLDNN